LCVVQLKHSGEADYAQVYNLSLRAAHLQSVQHLDKVSADDDDNDDDDGDGLCDQQVVGSNPTRGNAALQPWASCLHLCFSFTKQYNLVPAKGRSCSMAGEVTADLAESNGSLPPGG